MTRTVRSFACVSAVSVTVVGGLAVGLATPAQAVSAARGSGGFKISAPAKAALGDAFRIKCRAPKSTSGMTAQVFENRVPGVTRIVNSKGNCSMKVQASTPGNRKFYVIISEGEAAGTSNKIVVEVG